jgi:hypothetical protein
MTRLLLLASVLAVVFAACGSSTLSQPRTGDDRPSPRLSATIRKIAELRRLEARGNAGRLLRGMILPPGTRPVSQRLANAAVGYVGRERSLFTEYAYRHAFWRVREPLAWVVAFLRRHAPPNFTVSYVGTDQPYPDVTYPDVVFDGRSVGGREESWILVSLAPSRGATIVRVDAMVPWAYPRPPREVVPVAVREIDVHAAYRRPVLRRITNPRTVARIIRWFNDLNGISPGPMGPGCPQDRYPPMRLTFRSASGTELARAIVPFTPAYNCETIDFAIHGQRQWPLVDSTPLHGMAFVHRVQRFLGPTGRWGPTGH